MELLDREQERAALNELLEASRDGRGGALVLRGEPGVGLTVLLENAVGSAEDMRVARIRGVEAERDIAFSGVHQLCASMLDRLGELPGPQRDALSSAFGLMAGRSPDRFLVGLAVLGLLSQAAEEQPLLCAIDDAHSLDAASAEAIAFVARRLDAERIAVVLAVHEPTRMRVFDGIPELRVGGLPRDVARELLASVVSGPLDGGVRERLIAEAGGIPLALLELPAQLTPDQLAGLSSVPQPLPLGERLRENVLSGVRELPAETRTLLLLAAAEPEARTSLLWSAAGLVDIAADASAAPEAEGLLRLGQRVAFRHPLIGSAIYDAATVAERRKVHQAFADALDPAVDPDRRAWHRAAAALAPDEDVAAEVEASAARAKGRGDDVAAATLLERAAALTPDPDHRSRRTLAAAQAALAAGALGRAATLLGEAYSQPIDDLQRAQADRLRGTLALALGQGADRATTLLQAARALEPLDVRLARDTHLEALEAAIYSGRFESDLLETAEASRAAPRLPTSETAAADLLLDGLALLITAGHAPAVPTIRRALEALRGANEPRWLALGSLAAIEVWDDESLHHLTARQLQLARDAGARPAAALVRLGGMDDVVAGKFGTPLAEAGAIVEPTEAFRGAGLITPGEVLASAWRGSPTEARDLAEACIRDAFARDLGLYVALARYAVAVLEIGLGRYDAALAAAREACEQPTLCAVTAVLPELVEAAARTGEQEQAVSAARRLSERTLPSGTDWALGTLARSRALLEQGDRAEDLYRNAIEHLRRSRAAPQLARAHLLYGEWLRRERRRREAREQLRTARDMFIFMGAQGFGERARAELNATGEQARPRIVERSADLLTPQEARIARLVADGASNAQIAAQVFISPRTVEYHLHKVFRKLGVSSRTQLARALLESAEEAPTGADGSG